MVTVDTVPLHRSRGFLPVLIGLCVLLVGLLACGVAASQYNALVRLDQAVDARWSQVETVYQRRADLVPNLVQTVAGAARFERETVVAVAQARAQVGRIAARTPPGTPDDPGALRRFQEAQQRLSSALSRLIAVSERYPELRATQAFRDLQTQLAGTEDRIAAERARFNDAARQFNTRRSSFPTVVVAGLFGDRFRSKGYFHADRGATAAPRVRL